MYRQSFMEKEKTEIQMERIGGPAKALAISAGALPREHANSNLQRALNARMSLSEAIEAATIIVDCYPNGGKNGSEGYLGALAETLGRYPKSVAKRCADRQLGIVRDCKFLPTVADIVAWCERETAPLYEQSQHAERLRDQFAEREKFVQEQTVDRVNRLTVKELKEKYGDWHGAKEDRLARVFGEPRMIDSTEITVSPALREAIKRRWQEAAQ